MKCPNSWCPGTISENYDCRVCGHVLAPRAKHVLGVAGVAVVAILAIALACAGCVTAPNSNQSFTFNVFGSLSRSAQSQGGTNNLTRVQSDGGGGNGAHASMSP